jgi:hypothetical protein
MTSIFYDFIKTESYNKKRFTVGSNKSLFYKK